MAQLFAGCYCVLLKDFNDLPIDTRKNFDIERMSALVVLAFEPSRCSAVAIRSSVSVQNPPPISVGLETGSMVREGSVVVGLGSALHTIDAGDRPDAIPTVGPGRGLYTGSPDMRRLPFAIETRRTQTIRKFSFRTKRNPTLVVK